MSEYDAENAVVEFIRAIIRLIALILIYLIFTA